MATNKSIHLQAACDFRKQHHQFICTGWSLPNIVHIFVVALFFVLWCANVHNALCMKPFRCQLTSFIAWFGRNQCLFFDLPKRNIPSLLAVWVFGIARTFRIAHEQKTWKAIRCFVILRPSQ